MTIDDTIDDLFKVVQKKKSDLATAKKLAETAWKTKCSIVVGTSTINIHTANSESLVELVLFLLGRKTLLPEARKILNNITENTKIQGFEIDDWLADCSKRNTKIQLIGQERSLLELEERLNNIVSPEQRRILELEAIKKNLT